MLQATPAKKGKQTPAKKGAADPPQSVETPGKSTYTTNSREIFVLYSVSWCSSSIAQSRGEGEEREVDKGLERAQGSSAAPRSVIGLSSYSIVVDMCVVCVEYSVKQRLKLIKSKAVEVVGYLKVRINTCQIV